MPDSTAVAKALTKLTAVLDGQTADEADAAWDASPEDEKAEMIVAADALIELKDALLT